MVVPVNIFGDGNPDNGIEDSREQLMGARRNGGSVRDQRPSAGTLKCDGKVRGTAVVVDTRGFASDLKGVVLATAAHVLYDLETQGRFRRCNFHFLALGELPAYRAKVDMKRIVTGGFDPASITSGVEFGEGDWAFLYLPSAWKYFNPDETLIPREFSFSQTESFQQTGGEFKLVAYDSDARVISESRQCSIIESRGDDLGGGVWSGQLLDDCDSTGGASGGGIVAVHDQQQYLIGIRSGAHWSEEHFPVSEYPQGPPDGSVWNSHFNTNFGRAIDARLLRALDGFVRGIERL